MARRTVTWMAAAVLAVLIVPVAPAAAGGGCHQGVTQGNGDTVEIIPMYEELAVRIEFFGDEVEAVYTLNPLTGEVVRVDGGQYI